MNSQHDEDNPKTERFNFKSSRDYSRKFRIICSKLMLGKTALFEHMIDKFYEATNRPR